MAVSHAWLLMLSKEQLQTLVLQLAQATLGKTEQYVDLVIVAA